MLKSIRTRAVSCCVSLAVASGLALLSGCVAKEMAGNFTSTVKGDYYLSADNPASGEEYFRGEVARDPENPLNNYYYGRLLLRSQKAEAALPYLQRATSLEPQNADYQFWTGVAHGELQQAKQERARYEQVLKLEPEHQQALTALGNSYLRSRQYEKALKPYNRALALWPENPSALYNRALALSKLGWKKEASGAWHRYLAVNSSGILARTAVEHLNASGDFSYRNYTIGVRTVTTEQLRFEKNGADIGQESLASLERIGEAVNKSPSGVLQVVVYQKGNAALAKARAINIRKAILKRFPELGRERIGISWFGEPQRNKKKRWLIEESVDFFLTNQ